MSHTSHTTCIRLSFRFLHFCKHVAESPCLFVCLFLCVFLTLLCCDRFHDGPSLCIPVCLSLCSSLFVSVLLWCHSILTLLPRFCADLPLPLWVSVRSSVFPSLFPSLDVFRMWQKSCEPLYLFLSGCLSLSCWCYFHQAVHISEQQGDEHHVPVNTRPLAMLSHLVSSFCPFCWSLLIFQILKKFEKLTTDRELQGSFKGLSRGNLGFLLREFTRIYLTTCFTRQSARVFRRNQTVYALSGRLSWKTTLINQGGIKTFSGHRSSPTLLRKDADFYILACK